MANANTARAENLLKLIRLRPPEPLPESFVKRFPELRPWQSQNQEIFKQDVDELGRYLSLLVSGLQSTSTTPPVTVTVGTAELSAVAII